MCLVKRLSSHSVGNEEESKIHLPLQNEQAIHRYCEENNLQVSQSSQWKLNFLSQRPHVASNAKPFLNESLYQFDEISVIAPSNKNSAMKEKDNGSEAAA